MTNDRRRTARGDDWLAPVLSATGLVLLVWSILEPAGLFAAGSSTVFLPRYVVGYVTIVPSCLAMVWGGRWLRRSGLPAEYNRKIAAYFFLGGGGFLAFNVGLMTFFPTRSIWIMTNWIRWALTLGLAVGLLVGIAQSRAIYQTISAERQSIRAEHVEKQRDLVDHMNDILRHEVLNATQVILGNASSLQEADEPVAPTDERVARIHRQGEEVTAVIEEVRSLLRAMDDERSLVAMPLAEIVRSEARKITDRHPNADVDVRVPDGVAIQADELVGRVFGNLLDNAAKHNDAETVQIVVTAERTDGAVVTTVRDDGNGIPDEALDTLFDRPPQREHGMGLYLVRQLVRGYGGSIELVETGESGTTFEVRLPDSDTGAEANRPQTDQLH